MFRIKSAFIVLFITLMCLATSCNSTSPAAKLEGYLERGRLYFAANDYQRSLEQFLRAINLDQTNVESLTYLGRIYYAYYEMVLFDKKMEEAWKFWNYSHNCFNEAVKYQPDNIDAYFGLALLYYCAKKYEDGIKTLRKISTFHNADIISKAKVHRELGFIYYAQGKVPEAKQELEEYLKKWPEAPDAEAIKIEIKNLEKELSPSPPEK